MAAHRDLLAALSSLDFDLDYSSWNTRLTLIAAGFLFYVGIFAFIHIASIVLFATYRSLSAREKVRWNTVTTRASFGLLCYVAGLNALFIDPVLAADKITGQQGWAAFIILIATGFFLYENVALFIYNSVFRIFEISSAAHHITAFIGCFGAAICSTAGHYLPIAALLLEMATPFTCTSWILIKAGYLQTFIWKMDQWIVVHLFHCRMFLTYHLWWVSLNNYDRLVKSTTVLYVAFFFFSLILLTFMLNPYWTYMKTKQLLTPVHSTSIISTSEGNGEIGIKKNE
ncbi:protein CLN8-like [Phyllobates terribilis]|uniref:protein CLN8-like n=1 Tax=Phyllobates terribilis TaxID=111132 RepID=UPI003CCAE8BA